MIGMFIDANGHGYETTIFGTIGSGWDTLAIAMDSELKQLRLIPLFTFTPSLGRKGFIFNTDTEDWIDDDVESDQPHSKISGESWLVSDKETIQRLLHGIDVDSAILHKAKMRNREVSGVEWHTVKNHADVDHLMSAAFGFHDSEIAHIQVEHSFRWEESSKTIVSFAKCWGCQITLFFEGDIVVHFLENEAYNYEIFEASILFHDQRIYWVNQRIGNVSQISSEATWFRAKSLKWKLMIDMENPKE